MDPPEALPDDIVEFLHHATSEQRQALLRYAGELESSAYGEDDSPRSRTESPDTHVESATCSGDDSSDTTARAEYEELGDEERPDDVPAKATITIKEINDNRYYYWQWRDGDKIRSQYKGPVSN